MVIRVNTDYQLRDPKVATVAFGDTRMAPLWLVARMYVGWLLLDEGRHKIVDPGWMDGGQTLKGVWEQVVAPDGALATAWYASVLRFLLEHGWYDWCGKVIAVGEVVIGLALVLGLLTGLAAFLGALLSFTFLLAGAATNPLVFVVALGLMAAWKIAGYIGLDAFVLPKLGAPWHSGLFWKRIRLAIRPA